MRAKPPKNVTLEGVTIAIDLVPFVGRINDRYRTGGQYYPSGPKVKVVNTLTLGGEQVTVFHELLHNVVERSGMTREFGPGGGVKVERILDYLDSWIVALLQENPALVDYLTARP